MADLSIPAAIAGARDLAAPSKTHTRRWLLVASVILLAGLAVSLGGALLWRATLRAHDRQNFRTSASDVRETVEPLLRRNTDFVASLRAVLTMQPHMSATPFDEWFAELQGNQRQVGGLGTTVVVPVAVAELAAFQARRDADREFRELMGGKLQPVARSGRATYCLLSAGGVVTPYEPAVAQLLQGDWCDHRSPIGSYPTGGSSQPQLIQSMTDSGQFVAYPVTAQGVSTLFLETAFYRRGAPLASVAQRRAAVAGWVGSSFDITALVRGPLGDQRNLGVTLYHTNPGQPEKLVTQVGAARSAGQFTYHAMMQIDGLWRIVVRGSVAGGGLSPTLQGLALFVAGTIVSLLLFALVLILTRSREHALGMVQEKTGQLRHQALHDSLTGLPNRVLALDRAQQMLARSRRQQVPVAALYVDVDGFKHVNDTFGHAVGDELLQTVAARLMTIVREGDTAARLGGDEFVVLLEGSTLDAGPELVAERLLEVLRRPYDLNGKVGRQLAVTASIGIASGTRAGADELLRDADVALYEAKATGKNRYTVFRSGMQTAAQDRLTLEMDLAEALDHRQLFLLYQPTFDLQSESVIGVEALLRWRHPTRGIVSPVEFVPIAEDSGLIVPIGRWVLEEACHQATAWRLQGHMLGMSVNVSGRQLDADELIDDVRHALEGSGLDSAALTLEVTETTLMRDADATAKRLRSLKQLGVRIAIDDFGTGYSSLAYLRQFPADALKIDRSFISGIAASKESAALIHTLVQLGKALDIETLAEGIEEQSQLQTLQREHCDQGQGFLFARPLDVPAMEEFLRTTRSASPRAAATG
jgi:diguanylate cyclase (GGDEF)-like protein